MKKLLKLTIALFALTFSSCSDSNEDHIENMIGQMEAAAEVLEGIADGKDPDEAAKKLEEIATKIKELEAPLKEIDALPEDEQNALKEKFKDRSEKAEKRMGEALAKAMKSGKLTPELMKTIENSLNF